jgi:hypothetical protein
VWGPKIGLCPNPKYTSNPFLEIKARQNNNQLLSKDCYELTDYVVYWLVGLT